MMKSALASLVLVSSVLVAGCGWFQAHPEVASDATECTTCVGTDVVGNATSASPVPFYPQECDQLVKDCGSVCGATLVAVINGLAGSKDPKVQATPAYAEARARVAAMLAPDAGR